DYYCQSADSSGNPVLF
nr:immunoglobulin light chain junction region [Macaca mulatta]MOW36187.1 immunoglobulin light chain junction region [Macaca mulatta]MOW36363.1 immunoglobulin light chain junction region [Macaca mulatta]MOW36757.1 immunoglobulin light chain junction region [Macaca mulatta]MOW36760.1 immunoglobulin light chain junction region [Macaca mulatta]